LPLGQIAGTYLSTFEIKVVPLKLTSEEQTSYDRDRSVLLGHLRPFFQACPAAGWPDFVRAAARSANGREALAAFRRGRGGLALPGARVLPPDQLLALHGEEAKLVSTADTRSAYEVSRRFLVPAITCDIGREEREEILRRFREGLYKAIVSAKVLNE